MQSSGSPHGIADGSWHKCESMNGRSSYCNNNQYLHYCSQQWHITCTCDGSTIATSYSFGLHPLTIRKNEWVFWDGCMRRWCFEPQFYFYISDVTEPFMIEDLGEDFFLRTKMSTVVQWIHPITGVVTLSGAKGNPPGKKWCPFCQQAFSANNFSSQHMKNVHRTLPTIHTVRDVQHVIVHE